MDKKKTGADWAKSGVITLEKPQITVKAEQEEIAENIDNAGNTEIRASEEEKKHQLTVNMSKKDFVKLRIMAAQHGKSISAYLREVIINGEGK